MLSAHLLCSCCLLGCCSFLDDVLACLGAADWATLRLRLTHAQSLLAQTQQHLQCRQYDEHMTHLQAQALYVNHTFDCPVKFYQALKCMIDVQCACLTPGCQPCRLSCMTTRCVCNFVSSSHCKTSDVTCCSTLLNSACNIPASCCRGCSATSGTGSQLSIGLVSAGSRQPPAQQEVALQHAVLRKVKLASHCSVR